MSYFDGPGNLAFFGKDETMPQSGVWSFDLETGHKGVVVQAAPNFTATLTVILLDGATEIQRRDGEGAKGNGNGAGGQGGGGPAIQAVGRLMKRIAA